MLEVVDHEQQLAVAEVVRQRVSAGALTSIPMGDRARDLGRHQRWIGDVLQADECGAVGEALLVPGGELEQQPRLPNASRARQRHERDVRVGHQVTQRAKLIVAAHQPGHRSRQIR